MLRPARWSAAALLLAAVAAQGSPAPRVELPADWNVRDLEGKWVAYRRALDAVHDADDARRAWIRTLSARNELELLEWIVIFERSRDALVQLANPDAPQLLRAALWASTAFDSHGRDAATKMLLARAARVRAWLDANQNADGPAARSLRQQLVAAANETPSDTSAGTNDPPPLDPMQVLAPLLDAPARLERFGDRTTAEPRVRYLHQVMRALSGAAAIGGGDDRVVAKMIRLTAHADPEVAAAASDALTRLPPECVPFEPMLRIADDHGEKTARREHAVEVVSFSSHPRVQSELVRIALDTTHPARNAALERLRVVGDPVVIAPLRAAAGVLPRDEAGPLFLVFAAVDARLRTLYYAQPEPARAMLLRVAWLRANGDPEATRALNATADVFRAWSKSRSVAGIVSGIAKAPAPPSPLHGDEAARVDRELAALIEDLSGARWVDR